MRTAILWTIALALAPLTALAQMPAPGSESYARYIDQYRLPPVDVPPAPSPGGGIPDPLVMDSVEPEAANAVVEPADENWSSSIWRSWTKWEGSFELGLNGTYGNSETFNIQFGAKLKRETDFSKSSLEVNYVDQSSSGVNTAKNLIAEGRIEWPFGDSPWSLYAHCFGEYDEFKPFDFRLTGDAGLGYAFIETDCTTLKGRAGGGVAREFGGVDEDVNPEIVFGGEFAHKFSDRQKISLSADYYPNVQDFMDARINSKASWEVVVAPDWGLSLKLSAIDRYDTTPGAGSKHNDLNYAFLVLWSL
jgi:putative salt-induced outer membrane protein YdiY